MQTRKALGRGLDSLIPATGEITTPQVLVSEMVRPGDKIKTVPIDSIVPNRLQPRKTFNEEKIDELSASIREHGVVQPLLVTPAAGNRFELIAGERRLRAAKKAGLTEVPVVIKNVDAEGMLELSIIENIQREDLNPMEEAFAYQELIQQFDYTQEEVADKLGKSRAAITNSLRLLNLPKVVQDDVATGRMSAGHARALLSVGDLQNQLRLREKVLRDTLTVRDVERMAQNLRPQITITKKVVALSSQMKHIVDEMTRALATKVRLEPDSQKKGGRVLIEYYSPQDLDKIYNIITRR